ncbi:uncharacterized protein LOC130053518 [Ostrea edulis]|uniref:uncharacterized protein LOC130053518 n=1 Tax=Ostrea edulis TaxID=37623 RepID=UPI0024AF2280|nr:uncharacterized protein LOC130053518 [Ostrea edulis]
MDHTWRNRKRKNCLKCGEEYSRRHLKRHCCTALKQQTSSDKQEEGSYSACIAGGKVEPKESLLNTALSEESIQDSETEETNDLGCEGPSLSTSDDSEEELWDFDLSAHFKEDVDDHVERDRTDMLIASLLKVLLRWQLLFYVSDLAFSYLLLLFKSVLYLVSSTSENIQKLYKKFPSNLYQLHKIISFEKDIFLKKVVCPKCYALYDIPDCSDEVEGMQISKKYSNVVSPNHALAHFRRPCGEILLKTVLTNSKTNLVPKKTFCYQSIKDSLQTLVNRDGFEDLCELWRTRNVPDYILMDVFDGDLWNDFNGGGGGGGGNTTFFTAERNYGIMLNVDWFQPFKNTNYSVGAIYLTILNLPRSQRFKKENIILVGLIPDMKVEPPTNTFIEPFVE